MTVLSRRTVANIATLLTVVCGGIVVIVGVWRGDSTDLAVGASLMGSPAVFSAGNGRNKE